MAGAQPQRMKQDAVTYLNKNKYLVFQMQIQ